MDARSGRIMSFSCLNKSIGVPLLIPQQDPYLTLKRSDTSPRRPHPQLHHPNTMAAALCNHALVAGLAGSCARPVKSRRSLKVSAAQNGEAQVWLPGVERPRHLEGKSAADGYPGNRGFDPLGLGRDEDRIKW